MQINELTLRDFRNYHSQTVTLDPNCNVIFGENANIGFLLNCVDAAVNRPAPGGTGS